MGEPDYLHNYISPENLPKHYGGTSTTELRAVFPLLRDVPVEGDAREKVTAGASVEVKIPFEVENGAKDVEIVWGFEVLDEGKDIEYSAKFLPGDDACDPVQLIEPFRTDRNTRGSYVATSGGTIVLTFDNTYSWTTAKNIRWGSTVNII